MFFFLGKQALSQILEGRIFMKEEGVFWAWHQGKEGERADWAEGDLSCDVVLTKSSASPWEALELGWSSGAGSVGTRAWTFIPLH